MKRLKRYAYLDPHDDNDDCPSVLVLIASFVCCIPFKDETRLIQAKRRLVMQVEKKAGIQRKWNRN